MHQIGNIFCLEISGGGVRRSYRPCRIVSCPIQFQPYGTIHDPTRATSHSTNTTQHDNIAMYHMIRTTIR